MKKSEQTFFKYNPSDKDQAYQLIKRELDDRSHACGDALDALWKDMLLEDDPVYGDWQYAGQAYRHIIAVYRELQVENKAGKGIGLYKSKCIKCGSLYPDFITSGRMTCCSCSRPRTDKVIQLLKGTTPYVTHWSSCAYIDTAKCTCGLEELVKEIGKVLLE